MAAVVVQQQQQQQARWCVACMPLSSVTGQHGPFRVASRSLLISWSVDGKAPLFLLRADWARVLLLLCAVW